MNDVKKPDEELLTMLRERAKELDCLYQAEETLADRERSLDERLARVVAVLPAGWYHAGRAQACLTWGERTFTTPDYQPSQWQLSAPVIVGGEPRGTLTVSYPESMPPLDDGPFLKEERRLIAAVAERIGQAILREQLGPGMRRNGNGETTGNGSNWRAVVEMLRVTDQELFVKVTRKLLNHLCYLGVDAARELLERVAEPALADGDHEGINRPTRRRGLAVQLRNAETVFAIAADNLSDTAIYGYCQKWIVDERVSHLLDVLEDNSAHLSDVITALGRFMESGVAEEAISDSTIRAVHVSLIRRFFSRRLEFINLAKEHVHLADFHELTQRLIFPPRSNGHLGGKAAGLFLAMGILRSMAESAPALKSIRVPRTWYVTSDAVMDFVHHNHLEELLEHKYRDIDQIRLEYPNLVTLFKNSSFSPHMVKGLALALDDFGERPLIVRSSSLLEDGAGAAFSGKYKSLFLANQGSKEERLAALLDAIAEVYASMYGPDPIQYRLERGLLDFPEEMGLLIQEVVGTRVGKYLFPAFAGVAFSRNEFRWSPRIRREDGLIRLVPGLGTRAVDRVGDDYPVLVAPGQPGLRVNVSLDETLRYAPRYMDVINLETNSIETVPVEGLMRETGLPIPRARQVLSVVRNDLLQPAIGLVDPEEDHLVTTFEGLVSQGEFVGLVKRLLEVLQQHYGLPIDIEFAADERDFYLLQCRPQSSGADGAAPTIPRDLPPERVIFTARRHVSTAHLTGITHIVYVSPAAYDGLEELADLKAVGRTVGRLNSLLPKRQFILVGPGRWGSRGDIKLGVNVTYSDINNTAALVEVAFKKGNYEPDLSFGTHFFQDLVEASIAYLPLYPDERESVFNLSFLEKSENLLAQLLPDAERLSRVVRVIDVRQSAGGRVLEVRANGDEGEAVALLTAETGAPAPPSVPHAPASVRPQEEHWRWRQQMAERIARELDAEAFGVVALYLFGSTKNATAGPCSDIDLLVHFRGTEEQRHCLDSWLEGWSEALDEFNYLRTGFRTGGLLDVHVVTDEDIAGRSSFAVKIGAVSDAARPLPLSTERPRRRKTTS